MRTLLIFAVVLACIGASTYVEARNNWRTHDARYARWIQNGGSYNKHLGSYDKKLGATYGRNLGQVYAPPVRRYTQPVWNYDQPSIEIIETPVLGAAPFYAAAKVTGVLPERPCMCHTVDDLKNCRYQPTEPGKIEPCFWHEACSYGATPCTAEPRVFPGF
ncbi:Hypothetical protein POVN_LOCUS185 [uncultured virus]|nr:Hypothetical protein POVN_LOCUS185 [uncultured virus]